MYQNRLPGPDSNSHPNNEAKRERPQGAGEVGDRLLARQTYPGLTRCRGLAEVSSPGSGWLSLVTDHSMDTSWSPYAGLPNVRTKKAN